MVNDFDGNFQLNMIFMYLVIILKQEFWQKWQIAINFGYKVEQGNLLIVPEGMEQAYT